MKYGLSQKRGGAVVRTLKILGREVFLEFPEGWSAEFDKERPRKGKLTFFGPIRPVGDIYFHVGGESDYQLQAISGTISVFTVEEPVKESSETVLPNGPSCHCRKTLAKGIR